MLPRSIAIVVIFVLYLIDKNKVWEGAAKITAALLALAVLSAAGIYGWMKYEDSSAANKRELAVKACEKSVVKGTVVFVRKGEEVGDVIKAFCESTPSANLACGLKSDSDGRLTTYSIGDTDDGNPAKVCTAKGWDRDPMQTTDK